MAVDGDRNQQQGHGVAGRAGGHKSEKAERTVAAAGGLGTLEKQLRDRGARQKKAYASPGHKVYQSELCNCVRECTQLYPKNF